MTSTFVLATAAALGLGAAACSSDDDSPGAATGTGGSGGGGGETASGGKATASSGGKAASSGGASSGGATGTGGKAAGTGGAPSDRDGGPDAAPETDGGGDGGCVVAPLTRPTVEASMEVVETATLVNRFHAEGTQNYTCAEVTATPGTYSWGAATPEAVLFADCGGPVATHFGGPTWKSDADESTVVADKTLAASVAHAGTIPWLKLPAKANTGTGIFSEITWVQRVDTTGGAAPSDTCDLGKAGTTVKVPYTATYYFYTGPEDGGH